MEEDPNSMTSPGGLSNRALSSQMSPATSDISETRCRILLDHKQQTPPDAINTFS